ncbi:sensor histidine kinase [Peribacillus frigoritolerans]
MIHLTVLCMFIAIVFLFRFFFMKREMKRMTKQLQAYRYRYTEKKLDIEYFDRDIEKLAVEINGYFDSMMEMKVEQKRTEETLKQAIANMSHDLRTPLTSILGYIQLLEDEHLTLEERAEYIGIVKRRTKRLQDLLNEFFELSIVESVDYELQFQTFQLNQSIGEVLMNYYDAFHERQLQVDIDMPDEEIMLYADPSAVIRVVENLVSNVLKHSSGTVGISLKEESSSIVFTIRNKTDVMTEQDVERIFDRFYTGDTARNKKGTGLGLSIAQSLMKKMNGELFATLKNHHFIMTCQWKKRT